MKTGPASSGESDYPADWRNPDPGVQRTVEVLEATRRTSIYWWLVNPHNLGGWLFTPKLAYGYSGAWIGILLGLLVTGRYWADGIPVLVAVVAGVALYRLWDIVRWWVGFLIDRRHYAVLSRERNVLFLAINFTELTLIGAVLLRAADPEASSTQRWFDAFFLVTQLALPDGDPNLWEKSTFVALELSALLLFLWGLAALISLVGGKLQEQAWGGPRGGSGELVLPDHPENPPSTSD